VVSCCLQDGLTIEVVELRGDEMMGVEMGREGAKEGGIGPSTFVTPFLSCCSSSTCISASDDDGDTAACEAEFGCTQEASTITESETGQEGETEQEGETGRVMMEEDGVAGETREAQLFFPLLAAFDREAMEEDTAAGESQFCCTQGALFTPLTRDVAELEEGREGRGVIGVRMRMVR
jgi:hypothetical protein